MFRNARTRRVVVFAALLSMTSAGIGAANADVVDDDTEPVIIEYITNGNFDDGVGGWWTYDAATTQNPVATDGALCVYSEGPARWDAGLGYSGFALDGGAKTLSFSFTGEGTFKVNVESPDLTAVFGQEFTVSGTESFSFDFDALKSENAKLMFEIGGNSEGHTVCIDDVSLTGLEGAEDDVPPAGPAGGVNLLTNGDFSTGVAPWTGYASSGSLIGNADSGAYCAAVTGPLSNPWDAGFSYEGIDLVAGDYELSFDASTSGAFNVLLQTPSYSTLATTAVSGTDTVRYTVPFTVAVAVEGAGLSFQLGPLGAEEDYEFCLDNVFLGAPAVEYVDNGHFTDTQDPWEIDGANGSSIEAGALCTAVPGGTPNPWSTNIHLDGLELPAGPYALTFDASGTGGPMRALVGLGADPYTVYGEMAETPGPEQETYVLYFTLNRASDNAQIAFQVGGSSTDWEFCIDNVSLLSGGEAPTYAPDTGPNVRVNQYGYEAAGPKFATVVSDATAGLDWDLMDATDTAVASGVTTALGIDATAGLHVHGVDFSSVTAPGTYTLVVDGEASYPFLIGSDIYAPLQTDALNYFYLARSGIEIEESIVGPEYARAAGHVSIAGGDDANQGDYNVACQPVEESTVVYGEPWTCDYTLDVVGGWYDAGDNGKYVVNGGIATAQLLGVWERALRAGADAQAAVGDGALNVVERANGIPDVLDEAKWELDFLVSMMVPEGEDLAGMAHHKVHDYGWTGLPLLPVNATRERYLHRPSTAATLNLAATAAQGARLFEAFDADYSVDLLEAATTAWSAALENPEIYAPAADGDNGGGPYDDDDVSDEFYWAAAELYLTTGDKEYLDFLQASPVHKADSFPVGGFSWDALDAIAKINLATVDSDLPDRNEIVQQVTAGAQGILEVQQSQPFGVPLPDNGFVWGSNSQVLNNIVVLGAGYDVSGNADFLGAAQESMDYLLGRNALNLSYITDYGTAYAKNQHSRWFANQLNPELPNPPSGSVAGGPNADYGTWDSVISGKYPAMDCAPQFCYIDDIQSWATNEITINWNSALSAAASFLAAPEARVTVDEPVDPDPVDPDPVDPKPSTKFAQVVPTPDLSGDGIADVLAVDHDGVLWLYRGKANGGLSVATKVGAGWGELTISAPGDFNSDGKADILAKAANGDLFFYAGNGKGGFAKAVKAGWAWGPYDIIPAGDVTGDGIPDVLAIDAQGVLYYYAGNGKGGFTGKLTRNGQGWTNVDLYPAGDLNGDGNADILSIRKDGTLHTHLGRGDGGFSKSTQTGQGWAGYELFAGSDGNGDGLADLYSRDSANRLWFYAGKEGGFRTAVQVGSGW